MIAKKKVYVMGVKQVDFVNQETGEKVEGLTVWYFDPDHPEGTMGHLPSKIFIRDKASDVYKHGTGIYSLEFDIEFSGSRPKLNILDLKFEKKALLLIKDS